MKWVGRLWDNPGPDEGWSWVILAGSMMISALTFGIGVTGGVGVLFPEFIRVFQVTREAAMWPFTVIGLTQCFMGLTVGFLNNVFSTRAMLYASSIMCSLGLSLCYLAPNIFYITFVFGVLFGAGLGLANTLVSVLICKYFVRIRSTANAIYSAGLPISGSFTPFLINYLLHKYDLRSAMLLLGAIVFHMMIAAVLMRTRKPRNFHVLKETEETQPKLLERPPAGESNGHKPEEKQENKKTATSVVKANLEIIRQPMFIIITFQAIVCVNVAMSVTMLLPDYLMDHGISKDIGVILISVFSVSDLAGRIASGVISDKGYVQKRHITLVTLFLQGVGIIALCLSTDVRVLFFAVPLIGTSLGSANNLINIFYCDYLGLNRLFTAVSLRFFVVGSLGMFRPLIVGLSRDVFESYIYYFFLLAILCILSSASWLLEPYLKPPVVEPKKRVTLYRLSSRLLPKETYVETGT